MRIMPKMDQEHLLHDLQQAAIELAHKQYAEAVTVSPQLPQQRQFHNRYECIMNYDVLQYFG